MLRLSQFYVFGLHYRIPKPFLEELGCFGLSKSVGSSCTFAARCLKSMAWESNDLGACDVGIFNQLHIGS
jgi:hypothetical protein